MFTHSTRCALSRILAVGPHDKPEVCIDTGEVYESAYLRYDSNARYDFLLLQFRNTG